MRISIIEKPYIIKTLWLIIPLPRGQHNCTLSHHYRGLVLSIYKSLLSKL
nr:MAG TPA: hypothetical protein [Caudoviricetes sp.]